MKNGFLILAVLISFVFMAEVQAQSKTVSVSDLSTAGKEMSNFAGKYSSEGEEIGVIAFDMSQTGTKVEGKARYLTFGKKAKTVTLSVNGNIKNDIAYIQFKDQKGTVMAKGTLSIDGEDTLIFKQTTSSGLIPLEAVLLR
ncbi:hypothetical protein [Sphingobacterium spiritivorum]|uniref:hypothetical protein n=1 Tax=Sphingobacterium spiritivorum TaxID=258 RepID=UPI001917A39B|nr:hypothetical protein [Sphingobacterium spiritivorum]QQT25582.1 hypothetical protein I6J02_17960 [Sphingobacterium spiritivorum]